MENIFFFYFQFGFDYILDWVVLDYILFLLVFCVVYIIFDWCKVLLLVIVFIIGYCVSLFVVGMDWIWFLVFLIESFILVIIVLMVIYNLVWWCEEKVGQLYSMVLVFGLIYGFGFFNIFCLMLFVDE